MELLAAYSHAFAAVILFAIIVLALSPFVALPKGKLGIAPGATPPEDYGSFEYRIHRAYANGTETLPVFLTVVVAAALAGASPFWVNLLASLALVMRVAMLFLHLRGMGKPHGGLRSVTYVAGWASMLVIALLALFAVF